MSDNAWQSALAHLIEERIGVRLHLSEPWDTLAPFVRSRVEALKLPNAVSYVRFLRSEPADGAEFVRLVAVCTNGQTSFLRDHEQLRGLCNVASDMAHARGRALNVWSAGCSTGQEAYSLAMLLHDAKTAASILATDINADVLASARAATYSAWSLRNVPEDMRTRHFDAVHDGFRVHDNLRLMVATRQHNLLGDPPLPPNASTWDIILCRNVFIYHAEDTVARIVNNMARALSPTGYLFIGASENLHQLHVPFVAVEVGNRHAYRLGQAGDQKLSPREEEPTQAPVYEPGLDAAAPLTVPSAPDELRAFVRDNPRHAIAWLALGHACVNTHDFAEALDAYQHAQQNAPLLAETHYFQGVVHRKVGDMAQAEQSLRRALFLSPHLWPASFLLAGIYERQDRPTLQRKELVFTVQTLRSDHVRVNWCVPLDGFKSLHLDADSVLRTCENLLKTRV